MPMFFFDTFDGDVGHSDKAGMNLASEGEARWEALKAFPDMARDKIPDGDFRLFRSLVRDVRDKVIYEATMTLTGGWKKVEDARPASTLVLVS